MGELASQAGRKVLAVGILLAATYVLFKIVVGFVTSVVWILVVIAAVLGIIWALRVL